MIEHYALCYVMTLEMSQALDTGWCPRYVTCGGKVGWADPVVTASALMVVWSCSVTQCHAVSRGGVMRS